MQEVEQRRENELTMRVEREAIKKEIRELDAVTLTYLTLMSLSPLIVGLGLTPTHLGRFGDAGTRAQG